MGTSLCISRSACASTRQFPDRFVRCASACTVQVFSINALLKSLCLCVSVCLWPPLLVKRVTALEVESQWWCESPQPVSATSCIYVCVRWRDQNPVLSFVTRGVFYVAGIKVVCEACWGVISSGLAGANWSEESAMFGWSSLYTADP